VTDAEIVALATANRLGLVSQPQFRETLPRLVEERKALLDAAVAALEDFSGERLRVSTMEALQRAIAKAKAAATG
jgi:hypothetical protein